MFNLHNHEILSQTSNIILTSRIILLHYFLQTYTYTWVGFSDLQTWTVWHLTLAALIWWGPIVIHLFILQMLWSLLIPAILLHRHLLRGVVSVCQNLVVG